MPYVISAIIAYLIGSISSSVIITKKLAGFDVREKGSGNAGSTNVLRTAGKKAALLTLICDILKGVVAVLIAFLIGLVAKNSSRAVLVQLAALMVVVGHTFPIFFGFKGGKGVATSLGVLLIINWRIGLICLVFALLIMALTRMVSLGSIGAAVLFPVLVIFMQKANYLVNGSRISYIIFGLCLAAIVIFNHRTNLVRIINGNENKLSFKKKEEPKEVEVKEVADEVDEKDNEESAEPEPVLKEQPEIEVPKQEKEDSKEDKKKTTKSKTKKKSDK